MSEAAGPFKVVLSSVDDTWNSRLRAEVSRLFQIDDETASNIVSAIPIVVLDGLDARAAGIVRERMRGLVEAGCRVITTDDPADTIPRVNWPETPEIARVPADEPRQVITVRDGDSKGPPLATFSCPGCGQVFNVSGATRLSEHRDQVGASGRPGAGAPSGGMPGRGGQAGSGSGARANGRTAAPSEPGARLAGDEWLDPPIPQTSKPAKPLPDFRKTGPKKDPLLDDPLLAAQRAEAQPAAWTAPPPPPPRAAPQPVGAQADPDAPQMGEPRDPERVLASSEPTTLVAKPITNRFSRSVVPQKEQAPPPAPGRPGSGRLAAPPPPQTGRSIPPTRNLGSAPVTPPSNFGATDSTKSGVKKPARSAVDEELDVQFDESGEGKIPSPPPAKKPAAKKPVDDDLPAGMEDSGALAGLLDDDLSSSSGSKKKLNAKATKPLDEDDEDLLPFDELDSQGPSSTAPRAKLDDSGSRDGSFDGGRIDDLLDAPPQATVSRGKKPGGGGAGAAGDGPPRDRDPKPLPDSDDDDLLLDDEEPKGKKPSSRRAASADDANDRTLFGESGDRPALKKDRPGGKSKLPRESAFADALGMFKSEDEQPLDDGVGMLDSAAAGDDVADIKPLDLASDVQGAPPPKPSKKPPASPFDKPSSSAILEPLDPNEAMAILKTHQKDESDPGLPNSGERPPGKKVPQASGPLEPLDPNEALAILGNPDDRKGGKGLPRKPDRKKNGRTSDPSKLVPLSASDEDFAFLEQGKKASKTHDPFARAKKSPSGDKNPAAGGTESPRGSGIPVPKKRTDPFAKAAKELGDERSPKSGSKRQDSAKTALSAKVTKQRVSVPEGTGDCGLVLPRIANDSLREKAAELISEIKGVGLEDARKLTERTIIPVLTGVSRDVADFHREKFERHKISARVTTRQKEK